MPTMQALLQGLGTALVNLQIALSLLIPVNAAVLPHTSFPSPPKFEPQISLVPPPSLSLKAKIGLELPLVADIIFEEAEKIDLGVPSTTLALFLVRVESNFNSQAKNPNSSAKGLFQFLDGTWKALCKGDVFDLVDNSRCGLRLLKEGKISHWTADKSTATKLRENGFIK